MVERANFVHQPIGLVSLVATPGIVMAGKKPQKMATHTIAYFLGQPHLCLKYLAHMLFTPGAIWVKLTRLSMET